MKLENIKKAQDLFDKLNYWEFKLASLNNIKRLSYSFDETICDQHTIMVTISCVETQDVDVNDEKFLEVNKRYLNDLITVCINHITVLKNEIEDLD